MSQTRRGKFLEAERKRIASGAPIGVWNPAPDESRLLPIGFPKYASPQAKQAAILALKAAREAAEAGRQARQQEAQARQHAIRDAERQ